jgi:hypothetical protein
MGRITDATERENILFVGQVVVEVRAACTTTRIDAIAARCLRCSLCGHHREQRAPEASQPSRAPQRLRATVFNV